MNIILYHLGFYTFYICSFKLVQTFYSKKKVLCKIFTLSLSKYATASNDYMPDIIMLWLMILVEFQILIFHKSNYVIKLRKLKYKIIIL